MAAVEQLVRAVHVAASPAASPEERREAIAVVEAAKASDPGACLQAFQRLFESGDASAQLNGLTLVLHVVRRKWGVLPPEQQQQVVQYIHGLVAAAAARAAETPVRTQLASVAAEVAVQAGEACTEHTVHTIVAGLLQAGAADAFLGSKILQYLSEEVGEGTATRRDAHGAAPSDRQRRALLAAMTRTGPAALGLAIHAASHYLAAGASGAAEAAAARAAVAAILDALASLALWLPMRTIREAAMMEAVRMLLASEADRGGALEILLQLASRSAKHAARDAEDYATVYTATGELLAAALPVVCPPRAALDDEDDAATTLALRGAEAVTNFVLNGHLAKLSAAAQRPLLEQLALLLGSSHVPLAALAVPCWRKLIQAHARRAHRGAPEGASAGGVTMPEGALELVMRYLLQLVAAVVSPTDSEDNLPAYAESLPEWRELCGACKSAAKHVLADAATCAPALALAQAQAVVAQATEAVGAAQRAPSADASTLNNRLEVMAFVLDAILDAIIANDASVPGGVAALEALARAVLSLRPPAPTSLALCGRGLEALAPILVAAPGLAAPAVEGFFELAAAMHAARGGVSADSAGEDAALFAREQRQLTKAFCVLASRAPVPLAPQVDAAAARTQQLVSTGVFGGADRNTVFEGLAAIAARCGATPFARAFAALLGPLRGFWERDVGGLADINAFFAHALTPIAPGEDGLTRVGQADARIRIFHTLQLLTFCSREAKNVPASDGGGGGAVLAEHAEWMLLPALRLHRHLTSVAEACANDPALAPLRPALGLSPLERAVCIGQSAFLDAKARVDELDPGRLDHATVSGVRGWLRQCKELVLMLLVEVMTTAPSLWASSALAQATAASLSNALAAQEPRPLRLCIHHGMLPLTRTCPVGHAAQWLPPLLQPLLALLATRLGATWSEMVARLRGDVGGARAQQTEEEIVAEVLLRELSRTSMELLRSLVGSTSFPVAAAEQLARLDRVAPTSFTAVRRARSATAAGKVAIEALAGAREAHDELGGDAASAASAVGHREAHGQPASSLAWAKTAAAALMPAHRALVETAVHLAASAMEWPDQLTQLRAISVCRSVAAAAGAPANPSAGLAASGAIAPAAALQPLLVPCVLVAAVRALASAGDTSTCSELLLLIRSIYVVSAAQQWGASAKLREMAPGITEAAMSHLDAELEATRTEKHQKETLRAFFVGAGLGNLDSLVEVRGGAIQASNAAIGSAALGAAAAAGGGGDIAWPDLYDIHVAP